MRAEAHEPLYNSQSAMMPPSPTYGSDPLDRGRSIAIEMVRFDVQIIDIHRIPSLREMPLHLVALYGFVRPKNRQEPIVYVQVRFILMSSVRAPDSTSQAAAAAIYDAYPMVQEQQRERSQLYTRASARHTVQGPSRYRRLLLSYIPALQRARAQRILYRKTCRGELRRSELLQLPPGGHLPPGTVLDELRRSEPMRAILWIMVARLALKWTKASPKARANDDAQRRASLRSLFAEVAATQIELSWRTIRARRAKSTQTS